MTDILLRGEVLHGDCLEVLKGFADNSIDAVVTDPPYEIGMMGKKWDGTGIAYNVALWAEVLRVLKPGGHLLSFGGARTYHRMACAIEDAGFELRDCIMWLYGSGWPKGNDISKGIDKKFGAEREVIATRSSSLTAMGRTLEQREVLAKTNIEITAPTTPEAKQWEGWNTQLKPAFEPIVMARKPVSEKTIVDNVLKHGTGAINIDACRVETDDVLSIGSGKIWSGLKQNPDQEAGPSNPQHAGGRYPANVIHDGSEEVQEAFDAFGVKKSGKQRPEYVRKSELVQNTYGERKAVKRNNEASEGSASRFFYCAKASRSERGEDNTHATVKPQSLMRYLIKLITPPGGVVLDPFAGSGSTLIAARDEGFQFVGIEKEEEHIKIIHKRMEK